MAEEKTSQKVSTQAGRLLRDPRASRSARSVAASALTQAEKVKPQSALETVLFGPADFTIGDSLALSAIGQEVLAISRNITKILQALDKNSPKQNRRKK